MNSSRVARGIPSELLRAVLQDFFQSSSRNSFGASPEILSKCLPGIPSAFLHGSSRNFFRSSSRHFSEVFQNFVSGLPEIFLEFLRDYHSGISPELLLINKSAIPLANPSQFLQEFLRRSSKSFFRVPHGISSGLFRELHQIASGISFGAQP